MESGEAFGKDMTCIMIDEQDSFGTLTYLDL